MAASFGAAFHSPYNRDKANAFDNLYFRSTCALRRFDSRRGQTRKTCWHEHQAQQLDLYLQGYEVAQSVDNDGNYITQSSRGKHLDQGTAVMKGDKVCFTSAMDPKRDGCWTAKDLKVGQSAMTTSDKGEKLKVTRIKYAPLSMPK